MNRIHACLVGLLLCAASLPCAAQAPVAAKISSSELALQQQRESQAATRQLKRRIRAIVASADRRTIKTDYGLILDEGIVSRGLERGGKKPLVIAIHGYNSYPEHVQSILREPREAGMDCGVFSYPNDHEAAHSAKLLSQELKQLQQTDPQREVYLVAFSLGSVVAREAIENPQLDPGNVRRLVMISPPNQGSSLANFAYAMDLWEFIGSERRRELGLFFAAVEDGLAEASVDLRPGSLFLKTLNSRQRNDQVQYSIFLGDQGYVSEQDFTKLRSSLQARQDRPQWLQFISERLDRVVCDLDEVVHGRGDGVVSLTRGQLPGVDDVQVLPYTHTKAFDPQQAGSRQLMKAVAEKLR